MVMSTETAALLGKIYNGKVVPFIGNGASVDAGGPKTEELVSAIKESFPDAKYQSDDFIQTCHDVIETTLTTRADLERVVVERLTGLKPSIFHLQLPLHVWPSIFTTNYDDLIEQGYRQVQDRVQTPDTVFGDQGSLTLTDREKVKIFKLMGCITSRHPHNKLVLTRTDYNDLLRSRPITFRTLRDLMMDGTLLFVGYSFQDNLLLDILIDLQREMGDQLPYSYALMPDIDMQSVQAIKLIERRIIPLPIKATDLANMLRTGTQPKLVPLKDREGVKVVVKGQHKTISHKDFRLYSESFDFLYEEALTKIQPDDIDTRRDFFRGLIHDWTGYVRQWDFKRSQYDKILERVRTELSSTDVGSNRSFLISGPAGSGKTIVSNRIALDAYRKLGNPVIILRSFYEDIDLKLLASLCEELSSLERSKRGKSGQPSRARVLIIMESACSHVTDFKIIPIFMKSRGIPVLVLGTTRENEWEIACQKISEHVSDVNVFRLSDKFESNDERTRFAKHLNQLQLVEGVVNDIEISRLIEEDFQDSFFASVYSLIEPARPTLDDKVVDEYDNLSDLAQRAYILISSLYQYSLPTPLPLLVRTIGCSYQQFISEIYETEATKVICDVPAPLEGVYLGARHRIIAEKIIEKKTTNIEDLVELFASILGNVNYRNSDEVKVCRTLLIRYLGPNGIERRLSEKQTRRLFQTAIEEGKLEDSALLHHFGLFESDNGDQEAAQDLVTRALKLIEGRQPLFFLRSERLENIYNTMGLISSRKAQKAESETDVETAEHLYAAAVDYFAKAKGGELQTPHPYDSECRMYFYRAERVEDCKLKIVLYARALDVVDEGEENLPDEDLPRLLELRARIQEALSAIKDIDQVISEMDSSPALEADSALVQAKLAMLSTIDVRSTRERALEIMKRIAPSRKTDTTLLRTYSRLHYALYPEDKKGLYSILSMRYEIPREKRNLSLLYDIGLLSFLFEEYPKSLDCFRQLERLIQGHPKRWRIQDYGKDESGKVREFQGTVIRMESMNMGYVDIPQLKRSVPFLPYAQQFTPQIGENLTFNIGFNYRGWLAVDLSR